MLLTLVVPAAHAEADVEDGPLPELRGQVVLFVWVGDKGVVGCHHCHVQMNEILKEGRSVGAWITSGHYILLAFPFCFLHLVQVLTPLIPMALYVPVRIHISWLVSLSACHFDLFETPLRQVDIASTKIAA